MACATPQCPLFSGSIEVPYSGRAGSRVAFVGESPGFTEESDGAPFRGDAGIRLYEVSEEVGIVMFPENISLLNAARCRIDKKVLKASEIREVLKCCRPKLAKVLHRLKPKVIVLLGGIALEQITGQRGIKAKRGIWQYSEEFECWVLPTLHPAYTLRSPGELGKYKGDITELKRFIDDGYKIVNRREGEYRAVPSIRFMLAKRNITVAIDTEAQGLDYRSENSPTIAFSVSDEKGKGYTVWLCGEVPIERADYTITTERKVQDVEDPRIVTWLGKEQRGGRAIVRVGIKKFPEYDRRIAELRELLRRKDIKKTMMHGKYDLHRFDQIGIPIEEVQSYTLDIQAVAQIVDENTYMLPSLEDLQRSFSDMVTNQKAEFGRNNDRADMLAANPKDLVWYAGMDADGTGRVAATLKPLLLEDRRLANYYVNLVHPVHMNVLFDLEKNGVCIDREALPGVKEEVAQQMARYQALCVRRLSQELTNRHREKGLKLTRKDIVRDFLFTKWGYNLEPLNRTKDGTGSVGQDDLKILADSNIPQGAQSFIRNYLKYQEFQTLGSRYIKALETLVRDDGRIYSSYGLDTVTGRTNSRDPNLQNIPMRTEEAAIIRQLFIAPARKKLVKLDYNQAELRWIADDSQDPVMLEVFRSGADIHNKTARDVIGSDGDPLDRRKAKAINFGLIYGMRPKTLRRYVRAEYELDISQEEADRWWHRFFRLYAYLHIWHERRIDEARRNGFVRHAFGRIRHLPLIASEDNYLRSEAERQAINSPIQGPSSDAALLAASEVKRKGLLNPEKVKLVMFTHDDLVYEADDDYAHETAEVVCYEMEHLPFEKFGFELSVPLVAEASVGENLAKMEETGRG